MARKISRSVGEGNVTNSPGDVMIVQDLLNLVPRDSGGPFPLLKVDGLCFGKTNDAIKKFQRVAAGFQSPDGRVDPGGKTMLKLNEFEKGGSTQFQITRMEVSGLAEPRTSKTTDTFYLVVDRQRGQQAIYQFIGANRRKPSVADTNLLLSLLKKRNGEATSFVTQQPHSIAGLQPLDGLHSELSSDTRHARTGLSLILPDESVEAIIPHRWLTPTTTPGQLENVRGVFFFRGADVPVL